MRVRFQLIRCRADLPRKQCVVDALERAKLVGGSWAKQRMLRAALIEAFVPESSVTPKYGRPVQQAGGGMPTTTEVCCDIHALVSLIGMPAWACLNEPMIFAALNLLILIFIILRVDGLLGKINGTVYGGQLRKH